MRRDVPTGDIVRSVRTWIGSTHGRYRLTSIVAHDDATVTFGAEESKGRAVRKVRILAALPETWSRASLRQRFEREVRIGLDLSEHANVMAPIDIVEIEGRPAMVFAFDVGPHWSTVLERAHEGGCLVPPSVTLTVAIRAAEGLIHAHGRQTSERVIVHGSLRPSAIRVSARGQVRVADFGREHAPVPVSALRFRAPEQLLGSNPTPTSDVYSLAVVVAETLGGRPLYQGRDVKALVHAVVRGNRPPIERYLTFRATELETTLEAALNPDPLRRTQTAVELRSALERSLAQLASLPDDDEVVEFVQRMSLSSNGRSTAAPLSEARPMIVTPRAAAPLEPESFSQDLVAPNADSSALLDPVLAVAHQALGAPPERPTIRETSRRRKVQGGARAKLAPLVAAALALLFG